MLDALDLDGFDNIELSWRISAHAEEQKEEEEEKEESSESEEAEPEAEEEEEEEEDEEPEDVSPSLFSLGTLSWQI